MVEQDCPPTRGHFSTEPIAAQTDEVLAASNCWLGFARSQAEFFLGEPPLSQLPNMEQIRRIAEAPLPDTSSLDEIARRAREILLEAMTRQQLCRGAAGEVSSSTLHKPVVVVTCGQSGLMAGTDNRGCEDDRDLSLSGQCHARHHGRRHM